MASNRSHDGSNGAGGAGARPRPPEWADGLKQLYDSVVEEALPDSFKELLDRLDTIDPDRGKSAGGGGGSRGGRDSAQ